MSRGDDESQVVDRGCCKCCWPQRRSQRGAPKRATACRRVETSAASSLVNGDTPLNRPLAESTITALASSSNDAMSSTGPAATSLPRIVITSNHSPSPMHATTSDDWPFTTARTSRPLADESLKSMAELIEELRVDLLADANQIEPQQQQFLSFFRGPAAKPPLTASPLLDQSSSSTSLPPYPTSTCDRPPSSCALLIDPPLPTSALAVSDQPLRPLVGRVQRNVALISAYSYRLLLFVYWTVAISCQRLIGDHNPDLPWPRRRP